MGKSFEVIYSQQRSDFLPGRAYSNPRFFTSPRQGVTKVYLVGDWPKIRAAYEALGVPVVDMDPGRAIRAAGREPPPERRAPADLTPVVAEDERGAIYIPDDWADLPWTKPAKGRDLTLRGLAAMFSAEPVLNKAQAKEAVEGELRRRRSDEEASNGLTRREMNADLEAAGVEPDPTLDVEALADVRDEARGA